MAVGNHLQIWQIYAYVLMVLCVLYVYICLLPYKVPIAYLPVAELMKGLNFIPPLH